MRYKLQNRCVEETPAQSARGGAPQIETHLHAGEYKKDYACKGVDGGVTVGLEPPLLLEPPPSERRLDGGASPCSEPASLLARLLLLPASLTPW